MYISKSRQKQIYTPPSLFQPSLSSLTFSTPSRTVNKKRGWVVAPGFTQDNLKAWEQQDVIKKGLFFSIARVPFKDAVTTNPRLDKIMCQYDIKLDFQNCYKPAEKYEARCAAQTPCPSEGKASKGKAKGKSKQSHKRCTATIQGLVTKQPCTA